MLWNVPGCSMFLVFRRQTYFCLHFFKIPFKVKDSGGHRSVSSRGKWARVSFSRLHNIWKEQKRRKVCLGVWVESNLTFGIISSLLVHCRRMISKQRLPAISSFKVIEAVVGVNTVAFCVTGTNPAFVTSSSCWPAQTPRAVKKPLTFVWARTLYGVSANDMLTSDTGTSSSVKTLPVSRWWEHVQASQASFSVPMLQFFEQSSEKSFAKVI